MQSHFEQLFAPKNIAIVGVSKSSMSFGGVSFMSRLLESGFTGDIYPINPKADDILGVRAYPNLASLPFVPDLAVICVSARQVPGVLRECARVGVRNIHIFTAGFSETGMEEGKRLEEQIAGIAKEKDLLVIGPNCMGPYCPATGLTAWGAIPGRSGPLGIISQSGGITQRLTEYAFSLGIGVCKAVSIGNATVLDSEDFLEYMDADDGIGVIAMYIESVKSGRRFLELLSRVNRHKPIVFLKGGASEAGASTVASHTGRMTGQRVLWKALVRQTGVVPVRSMNELMDAVLAFCNLPKPHGKNIFVVGGGGGTGVVHADIAAREGLDLPRLSDESMERLGNIVPIAGSIAGNPLDLWMVYEDPGCLGEVLDTAVREDRIHMISIDRLVPRKAFHMPDRPELTTAFIEQLKKSQHKKPTVCIVDSEGGDPDLATKGANLRARFSEAGIPAYPSMHRAARALAHLHRYYARLSKDTESVKSAEEGG